MEYKFQSKMLLLTLWSQKKNDHSVKTIKTIIMVTIKC